MAPARLTEIDLGKLSDRELLLLTATRVNEIGVMVEEHDFRVDRLEAWRNQAVGVMVVVAIVVPALVSWLFGKL